MRTEKLIPAGLFSSILSAVNSGRGVVYYGKDSRIGRQSGLACQEDCLWQARLTVLGRSAAIKRASGRTTDLSRGEFVQPVNDCHRPHSALYMSLHALSISARVLLQRHQRLAPFPYRHVSYRQAYICCKPWLLGFSFSSLPLVTAETSSQPCRLAPCCLRRLPTTAIEKKLPIVEDVLLRYRYSRIGWPGYGQSEHPDDQ